MVAFRAGLYDHVVTHHPEIRVVWQHTGHMNVLSMPDETAELIERFISRPATYHGRSGREQGDSTA